VTAPGVTGDDDDRVAAAVRVLRAGGLVAVPTETVYGLGADAANSDAVRRVYAVKGRPADHPLIVHIASAEALPRWAATVPPAAESLAAACWPGPLTVVLHRRPDVDPTVTGGRDTIALRVPAHPLTLAVLEAFRGGIAAPSANRFGHVSPTTAQHVRDDLGEDVDLVLDGGPCTVGVESTIIDLTVSPPSVLRPGGIPLEALEAIVEGPVRGEDTGPRRAPGMLASHYAPRALVELVEDPVEAAARVEALGADGVPAGLLDPGPDPDAYARHLYEWLRRADEDGLEVLVAVPPTATGLGWAVRDRLRKAAGPR
jgi:L-threonylcarbamoyladenylate synthase